MALVYKVCRPFKSGLGRMFAAGEIFPVEHVRLDRLDNMLKHGILKIIEDDDATFGVKRAEVRRIRRARKAQIAPSPSAVEAKPVRTKRKPTSKPRSRVKQTPTVEEA